jgi:hypothetical protein
MSSSDGEDAYNPRTREWTEFEMHTLLCLLCKGVHRTSSFADMSSAIMRLTEELNFAVHRPRNGDWHEDDFDTEDVAESEFVNLSWLFGGIINLNVHFGGQVFA